MPLDDDRLEQFKNTKRAYDNMPQKKEFIIPTRCESKIRKYLEENDLARGVKIIPYIVEVGFNCSRALNIGVRNAIYDSIIITSPEVKPLTPVLDQLEKLLGTNIICQVWDEDEHGNVFRSLINSKNRRNKIRAPGMYFLAMFNKADIERINGWDEEFMRGYAFEDKDFGARWIRANISFVVRDDIQGQHQYHLRKETIRKGNITNYRLFQKKDAEKIIRCVNGLIKL